MALRSVAHSLLSLLHLSLSDGGRVRDAANNIATKSLVGGRGDVIVRGGREGCEEGVEHHTY